LHPYTTALTQISIELLWVPIKGEKNILFNLKSEEQNIEINDGSCLFCAAFCKLSTAVKS